MLPEFFSPAGVLPPGDHESSIEELRTSILVRGPSPRPHAWDQRWRGHLVDNLELIVKMLGAAGVGTVFVGGSFVEDKCHPNDIDGYFLVPSAECAAVCARLNRLDPWKVWRAGQQVVAPLVANPERLENPMYHRYRINVLMYPSEAPEQPHPETGTAYPSVFFRTSRRVDARTGLGCPRGIVVLHPR